MIVARLRNAIQMKHRGRTMQRCIHGPNGQRLTVKYVVLWKQRLRLRVWKLSLFTFEMASIF